MAMVAIQATEIVTRAGEIAALAGSTRGPGQVQAKIDINRATAAELERLPGITGNLSLKIIAQRPYRKIDDLVRRKILGRKQLAAIKEQIIVGSPPGGRQATPTDGQAH